MTTQERASETPQVDAIGAMWAEEPIVGPICDLFSLARDLERRLAEVNERFAAVVALNREAHDARIEATAKLAAAQADAERYRMKREIDYDTWLEMVSSVHRGPAQSKEEWLSGYDAEIDDYRDAARAADQGKDNNG